MNDCQGLAGRLFGHSYEPIHDVKPSGKSLGELLGTAELQGRFAARIVEMLAEATITKKYLCHVCTRCGRRVEK